ncbi:MAG: hypothetical protein WC967_14540 [Balneolaceae bacterium]
MKKPKEPPISFGLHSFKVTSFKLDDKAKIDDESNMGYKLQFREEVNKEEETVSIFLKIWAQEGEGAQDAIANIETRTTFRVSDIAKMIKKEEIRLPLNLGTTLLSIALSTTRGALAVKTEGHFLENQPLAVINPQFMYERFLGVKNEAD